MGSERSCIPELEQDRKKLCRVLGLVSRRWDQDALGEGTELMHLTCHNGLSLSFTCYIFTSWQRAHLYVLFFFFNVFSLKVWPGFEWQMTHRESCGWCGGVGSTLMNVRRTSYPCKGSQRVRDPQLSKDIVRDSMAFI